MTPIGSNPEQVEYRLLGGHGCVAEKQFAYHANDAERPLVWIGSGLAEVGLQAGAELGPEQFDVARALMNGVDPRTGERLVEAKLAVPDDAKVSAAALVRAVRAACDEAGVEPAEVLGSARLVAMFERAERSVRRHGEGALLRADHAGQLADAAGVPVEAVWGEDIYARAVANLTETRVVTGEDGVAREEVVPRRRVVGNLGYDVSFTLPKSHSMLLAFAGEDDARAVEDVYRRNVVRTFEWLEAQTAYGMRGHHGDGASAAVVRGTGYLGWLMTHRAARPVEGREVGDPHWHVHATIANMTRGVDGQWSTVAAGGRDLMRHANASDKVLKALVRHELIERFGVEFVRNPRSGAWEVAAIPDEVLQAFSKRGQSIEAMLRDLGFDPAEVSRRTARLAAARTREAKGEATGAGDATLRQLWQDEARAAGYDPGALAAAALPGVPPAPEQALSEAPSDAPSQAPGETPGETPGEVSEPAGQQAGEPSEGLDVVVDDVARQAVHAEQTREQAREQARDRLLDDVMKAITDPESGLTGHARRFTTAEAIAAVADALPAGAASIEEIETFTRQALERAEIVELPRRDKPAVAAGAGAQRQLAAGHMANAERWTTVDVVEAERVILAAAAGSRAGQGAAAVEEQRAVLARSVAEATQGFALSARQRQVLHALVTSDRAVDAVIGPPGTGKTTLMRAARIAWEAAGWQVAGAATAAVAAQNLTAESGIPSRTVAQWVWAIREAERARGIIAAGYQHPEQLPADDVRAADVGSRAGDRAGDEVGARRAPVELSAAERARVDQAAAGGLAGVDVLVLDEANLTDDRDRAVLYREAARTGTKLVEVGDHKQLRGVGCGSLFGVVASSVGTGLELTENRRQREQDERAALTSFREGRYVEALSTWAGKDRLVSTDTGQEAFVAMVATWMRERQGAPDAHTEMRGLVMLAATNDSVERINAAAQAVRGSSGELGRERDYALRGGGQLHLAEGDHVLIRVNDRDERRHSGADVLNGYRGVVRGIDDAGNVAVQWQLPSQDGHSTHGAVLPPAYVAGGGLSLGYAMTIHKAEGLTVAGQWDRADGTHQEGTVLVHAPGADNPALYVATSRHKDRMYLFAGLEQVEDPQTTYERGGTPQDAQQRQDRVVAALAATAAASETNANDVPVHTDLERTPTATRREQDDAAQSREARWRRLQEQLRAKTAKPASEQAPTQAQAAAAAPARGAPPRAAAPRAGEQGEVDVPVPQRPREQDLTRREHDELAARWAAMRQRRAATAAGGSTTSEPTTARPETPRSDTPSQTSQASQERARRDELAREAARRAAEKARRAAEEARRQRNQRRGPRL